MESPTTTSEMAQLAAGTHLRPVWSSQRAYILVTIAGVVGLGNLWRFPYMAGENGGGTFVLAYAICILLIGLPLMVLESSAGNLVGRGPVGVYRRIVPAWGAWFGWLLVALTVAIMSYYFVITGWTLGFLVDSLRGDLRSFASFTGGYNSLWYYLAIAALVAVFLRRGPKALEQVSRYLMPPLVVAVVGLAIFAQTLSGAGEGNEFYLSFDADRFFTFGTWRMAAGQAFYSLSIGMAFVLTYGSYSPKGVNLVASSAAVVATNSFVSIVAGLMVFPIVFTFGIAPDTGSQLSFTAFPRVFEEMDGGRVVGIVFFSLLFIAAFTSSLGGMTVAVAPVRDEFKLSGKTAAAIVMIPTALLGIPSALTHTPVNLAIMGTPFLDVMDQVTGSGAVITVGLIGAALISWRLPRDRLIASMNNHTRKIGPVVLSEDGIIRVGKFVPIVAIVAVVVALIF